MKYRTSTAVTSILALLASSVLLATPVAVQAQEVDSRGGGLPQSVFDDIYKEVATPYEYGIVLPKGDQIADFDSELTDQMNVFKIPGDEEYVYTTYVGKDINRKTDGTDNTGYSTGLARSKDMVSWEKLGKILEPDKGFYSGSAAGYLVKEHTWGDLPIPHKTADGKYAMTVLATDQHGYEQGTKRGGVAFSDTDSFFKADGNVARFTMYKKPVLDGSASYEHGTIWAMKTIWEPESQRYVTFYNASHGPEVMNQAYSTDLINWDREAANPVLTPFEQPDGEKWGTLYNGDADVVKIGDYWVMFYFTDTPVHIGNKVKPNNVIDSFAVSTDMVHWQKSDIKLTAKNSTYAKSYAHKPAVVKKNGVVYHYYNAVSNQDRQMALSTSVDLSPVREAKHVLANSNDSLLSNLLEDTQHQLIRSGGSLEAVTASLDRLRLYLHPESDAGLLNASVTYKLDGRTHQVALAQQGGQAGDYQATIPSSATDVRLLATPHVLTAAVSVDGASIDPNVGISMDFDPREGSTPVTVVITSTDGGSHSQYRMTIRSDYSPGNPGGGNNAKPGGGSQTPGAPSGSGPSSGDASATDPSSGGTASGHKSSSSLATTGGGIMLPALAAAGALLLASGLLVMGLGRRRMQ